MIRRLRQGVGVCCAAVAALALLAAAPLLLIAWAGMLGADYALTGQP